MNAKQKSCIKINSIVSKKRNGSTQWRYKAYFGLRYEEKVKPCSQPIAESNHFIGTNQVRGKIVQLQFDKVTSYFILTYQQIPILNTSQSKWRLAIQQFFALQGASALTNFEFRRNCKMIRPWNCPNPVCDTEDNRHIYDESNSDSNPGPVDEMYWRTFVYNCNSKYYKFHDGNLRFQLRKISNNSSYKHTYDYNHYAIGQSEAPPFPGIC